jgi:hypothetical protein
LVFVNDGNGRAIHAGDIQVAEIDNCELDRVRQMVAEQRAIPAMIVDAIIARLDSVEAKSKPPTPMLPVEEHRVSMPAADEVA